jgi:hypothetical protein
MLAQALHQAVGQPVEIDRRIGDLTQRHDRVLVVVAVEGERRAGRDVASPLGRQHDQLEPVRDLQDTIFNGDARHSLSGSNFQLK